MSKSPAASQPQFKLRLYITGATHHSMLAVKNIKFICEKHMKDDYDLEIIDVYQQPDMAMSEDIIAAPTLIKFSPDPIRKLIGDLSNTDKVLSALGLRGIK